MKTFLHSGGLGDIIYSLPVIRELGGGIVYIKKQNQYNRGYDCYREIRDLLLCQYYITDVKRYPDLPFFQYDKSIYIDIDLDVFRHHPDKLSKFMVDVYFESFGLDKPKNIHQWIEISSHHNDLSNCVLINKTTRYTTDYNWKELHQNIIEKYISNVYFIGYEHEYLQFINNIGFVQWLPTANLLEVAGYIKDCNELYCNQSACLTIAQAMDKDYHLEVADNYSNCIMSKPNETLLNR